jgi:hypothetical protein
VLRLRSGDGHAADDTTSCYVCHGDNYGANGRNVHSPDPDPVGGAFAGASTTDTMTVPAASVDVSPAVEPTGSVDATVSVTASETIDATASGETTESVEVTQSVEPSETAGWLPELPSLPDVLDLLFGPAVDTTVSAQ